jgi:hypothetical protein
MPRFPVGWWPRRRNPHAKGRDQPIHVGTGDLDVLMPPPYDVSDSKQDAARSRIEKLVSQLQPGGLDAGSREVLNNLINAVADQEVSRLQAERDERQAVGEILIGLAQKQVARHRPRYDADVLATHHAHEALAVAFEALTGRKLKDLRAPFPRQPDNDQVGSSFGPVDITDSWIRSDEAAAKDAAQDGPPVQDGQPNSPTIRLPLNSSSESKPQVSDNGQHPKQDADTGSDPYGEG